MDLRERSDQDLLSDTAKLVGSHRELTAKLVAHLAEIEERRLHLVAGFSSMFDFCQRKLRLSEGEAFRRILAARLSRRFPAVLSLLASGSVHLSTLELLREWLDLLLADLERKRLGRTKRPRREPSDGARKPSRVTTAVRREVYERDGVQCTYLAGDGRRCEARAFLELDHAEPKAFGGSNDAQNLRVRCRAHNQLWAEQAFGRERVERPRRLRQQKSTLASSNEQHAGHECGAFTGARDPTKSVLEKVRLALRGMGFRDAEARRAISEVVKMHGANESLVVEQALREALLVATAA